jgi:predicted anti-sigma-YlaC factor YlaD
MKTCNEILHLLDDHLNGTLDKSISLEVENHITICTDCTAFLNTYKTTVNLIKDLKGEEVPSTFLSKT